MIIIEMEENTVENVMSKKDVRVKSSKNEDNCGQKKCDNGMDITESTLELQGLSGSELTELAGGQSELVTLKLQSDRSLWLGDSVLTACYVGQLCDLHHIPTFNGKRALMKIS